LQPAFLPAEVHQLDLAYRPAEELGAKAFEFLDRIGGKTLERGRSGVGWRAALGDGTGDCGRGRLGGVDDVSVAAKVP
jgi:hypothetical protein